MGSQDGSCVCWTRELQTLWDHYMSISQELASLKAAALHRFLKVYTYVDRRSCCEQTSFSTGKRCTRTGVEVTSVGNVITREFLLHIKSVCTAMSPGVPQDVVMNRRSLGTVEPAGQAVLDSSGQLKQFLIDNEGWMFLDAMLQTGARGISCSRDLSGLLLSLFSICARSAFQDFGTEGDESSAGMEDLKYMHIDASCQSNSIGDSLTAEVNRRLWPRWQSATSCRGTAASFQTLMSTTSSEHRSRDILRTSAAATMEPVSTQPVYGTCHSDATFGPIDAVRKSIADVGVYCLSLLCCLCTANAALPQPPLSAFPGYVPANNDIAAAVAAELAKVLASLYVGGGLGDRLSSMPLLWLQRHAVRAAVYSASVATRQLQSIKPMASTSLLQALLAVGCASINAFEQDCASLPLLGSGTASPRCGSAADDGCQRSGAGRWCLLVMLAAEAVRGGLELLACGFEHGQQHSIGHMTQLVVDFCESGGLWLASRIIHHCRSVLRSVEACRSDGEGYWHGEVAVAALAVLDAAAVALCVLKNCKVRYVHAMTCLKKSHRKCSYELYFHHHHDAFSVVQAAAPARGGALRVAAAAAAPFSRQTAGSEKDTNYDSSSRCGGGDRGDAADASRYCAAAALSGLLLRAYASLPSATAVRSTALDLVVRVGLCCCLPLGFVLECLLTGIEDEGHVQQDAALGAVSCALLQHLGGAATSSASSHFCNVAPQSPVSPVSCLLCQSSDLSLPLGAHATSGVDCSTTADNGCSQSSGVAWQRGRRWHDVALLGKLLQKSDERLGVLVLKHIGAVLRMATDALRQELFVSVYFSHIQTLASGIEPPMNERATAQQGRRVLVQHCLRALPSLLSVPAVRQMFVACSGVELLEMCARSGELIYSALKVFAVLITGLDSCSDAVAAFCQPDVIVASFLDMLLVDCTVLDGSEEEVQKARGSDIRLDLDSASACKKGAVKWHTCGLLLMRCQKLRAAFVQRRGPLSCLRLLEAAILAVRSAAGVARLRQRVGVQRRNARLLRLLKVVLNVSQQCLNLNMPLSLEVADETDLLGIIDAELLLKLPTCNEYLVTSVATLLIESAMQRVPRNGPLVTDDQGENGDGAWDDSSSSSASDSSSSSSCSDPEQRPRRSYRLQADIGTEHRKLTQRSGYKFSDAFASGSDDTDAAFIGKSDDDNTANGYDADNEFGHLNYCHAALGGSRSSWQLSSERKSSDSLGYGKEEDMSELGAASAGAARQASCAAVCYDLVEIACPRLLQMTTAWVVHHQSCLSSQGLQQVLRCLLGVLSSSNSLDWLEEKQSIIEILLTGLHSFLTMANDDHKRGTQQLLLELFTLVCSKSITPRNLLRFLHLLKSSHYKGPLLVALHDVVSKSTFQPSCCIAFPQLGSQHHRHPASSPRAHGSARNSHLWGIDVAVAKSYLLDKFFAWKDGYSNFAIALWLSCAGNLLSQRGHRACGSRKYTDTSATAPSTADSGNDSEATDSDSALKGRRELRRTSAGSRLSHTVIDKYLHLVSLGSRQLSVELWANPASGSLLARFMSLSLGENEVLSDLMLGGIFTTNRWQHLCANVNIEIKDKQVCLELMCVVDGCRQFHEKAWVDVPRKKLSMAASDISTLGIGHSSSAVHNAQVVSIGNVMLFRDVLPPPLCLQLFNEGIDAKSFAWCECSDGYDFDAVNTLSVDVLQKVASMQTRSSGEAVVKENKKKLADLICLVVVPEMRQHCIAYPWHLPVRPRRSAVGTLRRLVSVVGWSGSATQQHPPSARGPPSPVPGSAPVLGEGSNDEALGDTQDAPLLLLQPSSHSVAYDRNAVLRHHSDILAAVVPLGGVQLALFMLAKTVEQAPDAPEQQAMALDVLLHITHKSTTLAKEFSRLAGALLLAKITGSSRFCSHSPAVMKVLLKYSFSNLNMSFDDADDSYSPYWSFGQPSVLLQQQQQQSRDLVIIRDTALIRSVLLDCNTWQAASAADAGVPAAGGKVTNVWLGVFLALKACVSASNLFKQYNTQKIIADGIWEKLLVMPLEWLRYAEDSLRSSPTITQAMVEVIECILFECLHLDNFVSMMRDVCHLLLLLHPAAATFVHYDRRLSYVQQDWVSPSGLMRQPSYGRGSSEQPEVPGSRFSRLRRGSSKSETCLFLPSDDVLQQLEAQSPEGTNLMVRNDVSHRTRSSSCPDCKQQCSTNAINRSASDEQLRPVHYDSAEGTGTVAGDECVTEQRTRSSMSLYSNRTATAGLGNGGTELLLPVCKPMVAGSFSDLGRNTRSTDVADVSVTEQDGAPGFSAATKLPSADTDNDGMATLHAGLQRAIRAIADKLGSPTFLEVAGKCSLTSETLIVYLNHESYLVRHEALQLILIMLRMKPAVEVASFVKNHGFHLIASQLRQHSPMAPLVDICLSLLSCCPAAPCCLRPGSINDVSEPVLLDAVIPIMAMLDKMAADQGLLLSTLSSLKEIFEESNAFASYLFDHGLFESLCNTLGAVLKHVRSIGDAAVLPAYRALLNDLRHFMTSVGIYLERNVASAEDCVRLLEETFSLLIALQRPQVTETVSDVSLSAWCINAVDKTVLEMYLGVFNAIRSRALLLAAPVFQGTAAEKSKETRLPRIRAQDVHAVPIIVVDRVSSESSRSVLPIITATTNYKPWWRLQSAKKMAVSGAADDRAAAMRSLELLRTKLEWLLPHAAQYVMFRRKPHVTAAKVMALDANAVVSSLLAMFAACATPGSSQGKEPNAGMWQHLLTLIQPTLKHHVALVTYHFLSPLCVIEEALVFTSEAAGLQTPALFSGLQIPGVVITSFVEKSDDQLSPQQRTFLLSLADEHVMSVPFSGWNLWTASQSDLRHTWNSRLHQALSRAVRRVSGALDAVSQQAMQATRNVVNTQNVARQKLTDHVKTSMATMAATEKSFRDLIHIMTHERAVWHDEQHAANAWQLDPTEGPARVRKRLMPCRLRIEQRRLLPERRHLSMATVGVAEEEVLAYLFEDGRQEVQPTVSFGLEPLQGGGSAAAAAALVSRLDVGEKIVDAFKCTNVALRSKTQGELLIGQKALYFAGDDDVSHGCGGVSVVESSQVSRGQKSILTITWLLEDIEDVQKRRHHLQDNALEIFLTCGRTALIAFESEKERNAVWQKLDELGVLLLSGNSQGKGMLLVERAQALWLSGRMTNFDYLMHLNTAAGRSFNDLMQYPIFPYVLADYEGDVLDLRDPASYRKLAKPIACQKPENERRYICHYKENADNVLSSRSLGPVSSKSLPLAPYHYASLYSNSGVVLHYLVRLLPYTLLFLQYQDGNFDLPDRTFHSVSTSWQLSSDRSQTDVKELTPEFFSMPEFLCNDEGFDFGRRHGGETVHDVELPQWCRQDPRLFILIHRQVLESDSVSLELASWIDLIFGCKQTGKAAVDAVNVFHPATYYGLELNTIEDDLQRKALYVMIQTYGQVPRQLFKQAHPVLELGEVTQSLNALMTSLPSPLSELSYSESIILDSQLPNLAAAAATAPSRTSTTAQAPLLVPVMKEVIGLRWGCFVGSPECLEPVLVRDENLPEAVQSLVALPTGQVLGHSRDKQLIVIYRPAASSRDAATKVAFTGAGDPRCAAALSWAAVDSVLRLRSSKNAPFSNFLQLDGKVSCCAVSQWSCKQLILGYCNGVIKVYPLEFNTKTEKKVDATTNSKSAVCLYGHLSAVQHICICVEYSIFVSADEDGIVIMWDLNRLTYVRSLIGSCDTKEYIDCLAISSTLGDIAIASHAGVDMNSRSIMKVFSINARPVGTVRMVAQDAVRCVAYSTLTEGRGVNVIVAGLSCGVIRLWSSWDLQHIRDISTPYPADAVISITFSHDCQRLVAVTQGNRLLMWERGMPYGHHFPVTSSSTNSSKRQNFTFWTEL